jgi:hypothetical protein
MPSATAQLSTKLFSPRTFSSRTRARFRTDRLRQIGEHLGRPLTYPEQLLCDRVVSLEWWLRRLDARIGAGEELSGHAIRGRMAAEQRLRLDMQAIGLDKPQERAKPTKPRAQTKAAKPAPPPFDGLFADLARMSDADDERRLVAELQRREREGGRR